MLKGETLEQAAIRKVREETGLKVNRVQPVGYFENLFEANPFSLPSSLHSISVVFLAAVDDFREIELDYQSSNWKYSSELPKGFLVKPFIHLKCIETFQNEKCL